jgi:hypothetical protein
VGYIDQCVLVDCLRFAVTNINGIKQGSGFTCPECIYNGNVTVPCSGIVTQRTIGNRAPTLLLALVYFSVIYPLNVVEK